MGLSDRAGTALCEHTYIADQAIPDVPFDVELQLQRQEYLTRKHIDEVKDELPEDESGDEAAVGDDDSDGLAATDVDVSLDAEPGRDAAGVARYETPYLRVALHGSDGDDGYDEPESKADV